MLIKVQGFLGFIGLRGKIGAFNVWGSSGQLAGELGSRAHGLQVRA